MTWATDWSNLDRDMIEVIAEKLDSCSDYVRVRAVCLGWRSFLCEKPPKHLQQRRFPYLLVPPKSSSSSSQFSLFSSLDLDGETVHQFQPPCLAEGRGKEINFRGFSKGWLVAIEKDGPSIYLINPFTGDRRLLPPINTFPDVFRYFPDRVGNEFVIRRKPQDRIKVYTFSDMYLHFVQKIVLSSPPTATNCIAMAIFGEGSDLAYCKYGDKGWTNKGLNITRSMYSDGIFYKDKFYFIEFSGRVVAIDFHSSDSSPRLVRIANPPETMVKVLSRVYLVMVQTSCDDHLLLVARNAILMEDAQLYGTAEFKMFKLNLDTRNSNLGKWSKTNRKTLFDHVLFLGWNDSVSFPSHKFPRCKGNLIYFTDDDIDCHLEDSDLVNVRGSDVGVFNLENNTVNRLQGLQHPQSLWPPPIWVMRPNP